MKYVVNISWGAGRVYTKTVKQYEESTNITNSNCTLFSSSTCISLGRKPCRSRGVYWIIPLVPQACLINVHPRARDNRLGLKDEIDDNPLRSSHKPYTARP